MLVRVPEYYDRFHCLAGACPHSCCEKWVVVIDGDHACRYGEVPGPLGEKLRAALRSDEEGDFCFLLNGERCPFLDEENLCEIHKQLGEEATSVTCQEHPRFTEDYGPFREITLSASCPAANALLLGGRSPLAFREFETKEPGEDGDPWLEWLVPLRDRMLGLLAERTVSLRVRLKRFLTLAFDVQTCLDEEEEVSSLLRNWRSWELQGNDDGVPVFPGALRALGALEILEPDWPGLLREAETAPAVPVSEELLDRIAVYLGFRYLLKAVNDGDLLGRAQFVVLAVLVIERVSAVCGLAEALRRFSCEIEHNDENLEALLRAFWTEEALSLGSMLRELQR